MKVVDIEVGQKFTLKHNGKKYMRIADMEILQGRYPQAILALDLETYILMLVYKSSEIIIEDNTSEDIEYQGEVHNDKCD